MEAPVTRDELLASVVARAEADARILALLLGGSLGMGGGDAWSDLDLVAVVAPEHHAGFTEGARAWVEAVTPLTYWRAPFVGAPLFNAITPEWLRADLTVTVPGHVAGARNGLKPLVDRAEVWARLPLSPPLRAPDPARISALIDEFIRVFGLLPLSLGRGELAVGVTGVALQRQALISLLIEELDLPQPPGALHLSRLLPPEDMALLDALPPMRATRESILAVQHAITSAFIPRARRLMERVGAEWPEAFWTAALSHVERSLGEDWPPLA